ncbi:hypothetical protein SDRG_02811 [Saprolegnia diclina VS20]|uniref:Uncharacterized protein n=1 Tax=Saprolegnia diclina (strain VS20) TaxID=1156394 RepID=T0QZL5_SAPDV|nr:hypothetical protein SDRG_02811 [Saprolegnia diclina VS20]EQC40161.1 hypothetical protein SDRG_02811 [Saprolegnia diclina VS20]|eukprot:XP_008606635.1 hypothetical protein SDRG_02811 [Saprolegnia diclina VS20]
MEMVWDLCRVNFTSPDASDRELGTMTDAASMRCLSCSWAVGHSVLVALWVAYLGVYHDFDILLLRAVPQVRSNEPDEYVRQDAVVWVRGDTVTSCPGIARSNLATRMEAAASTSRSQHKSLLFVADGYAPSEMITPGSLLGALTACHVIASSASGHDTTERVSVALPAWSKGDLAHVQNETIASADERYAMVGGCVRQFLERPLLTWRDAPDSVASTEQVYIHDTHDYVHYVLAAHRCAVVDVKRALRRLTTSLSTAYLTEMLEWTATSSNESLYELLFDATIRKRAVDGALQLSTGDASRTLAVTGKVVAHGESTGACLHYLTTDLEDATHWLPHRAVSFGAVDAVVVQDRCVYDLKTTVATDMPSIDSASLQTVHAAVVANPNVAEYDHVYVFVTPAGRAWQRSMDNRASQLPGLCVWCAPVL